jgi:hypothetical protein
VQHSSSSALRPVLSLRLLDRLGIRLPALADELKTTWWFWLPVAYVTGVVLGHVGVVARLLVTDHNDGLWGLVRPDALDGERDDRWWGKPLLYCRRWLGKRPNADDLDEWRCRWLARRLLYCRRHEHGDPKRAWYYPIRIEHHYQILASLNDREGRRNLLGRQVNMKQMCGNLAVALLVPAGRLLTVHGQRRYSIYLLLLVGALLVFHYRHARFQAVAARIFQDAPVAGDGPTIM